jgi:hypothetical protein
MGYLKGTRRVLGVLYGDSSKMHGEGLLWGTQGVLGGYSGCAYACVRLRARACVCLAHANARAPVCWCACVRV